MNLQKINWKIFFKDPTVADLNKFFRVFNTWIPDSPEIFVDVADYQHVHDGPKTLLVGHDLDYALDDTGRRLGFHYNRKKTMEGGNAEKLALTLKEFLKTCERLVADPLFEGRLSFLTNELLLITNDRALSPNTKETFAAVKPDLEGLMEKTYGKGAFGLTHLTDPKQRFSVLVRASLCPTLPEMIQRI